MKYYERNAERIEENLSKRKKQMKKIICLISYMMTVSVFIVLYGVEEEYFLQLLCKNRSKYEHLWYVNIAFPFPWREHSIWFKGSIKLEMALITKTTLSVLIGCLQINYTGLQTYAIYMYIYIYTRYEERYLKIVNEF